MLLSGATSISGANFSYFRLSDNDDLYHCNALSSSRSAEKIHVFFIMTWKL